MCRVLASAAGEQFGVEIQAKEGKDR
jgi:hypothetical protein